MVGKRFGLFVGGGKREGLVGKALRRDWDWAKGNGGDAESVLQDNDGAVECKWSGNSIEYVLSFRSVRLCLRLEGGFTLRHSPVEKRKPFKRC